MASVDPVAKSIVKVGVHTCSDDTVGNIHVQEYTQFSLEDNNEIKLKRSENSFNNENEQVTERVINTTYAAK